MARSIRSLARRFGRKLCCIPKTSKSSLRANNATYVQRRRREIAWQARQRRYSERRPSTVAPFPRPVSDPGIAERGIRGLRGGGCIPSKPAQQQQQPSRTSQRNDEEVMLANLRRRYPDYGVTPSATSAGVSVLRPDTHPGADRRSASQQQNDPDAITPRGFVRGVRGGCSNPDDNDEEVQPGRVALPRRGWRANRASAVSRLSHSRNDEAQRGALINYHGSRSKAPRYQDPMLRGGADESEPTIPKMTILSKLKRLLCCFKAEPEWAPAQPLPPVDSHNIGPGRQPPPVGYRYSLMQQGPLPTRTPNLAQIPEGEQTVPSPLARSESERTDSPTTVKRRNAALPFPSLTRQQARVPDDDESSLDVRELSPTDLIEVQPQSRFSAASSGVSSFPDDLDRDSNQANATAENSCEEWEQFAQITKAGMAESQRTIEGELHSGLRGGQDESEIYPPRLSVWSRLKRSLCCGRPDDDQSWPSTSSQQGSPPGSPISHTYSQPHPEEGGIGLAMTLPEPEQSPATPSSLLGLRPQSRLSDAHSDNDVRSSSTIRQVSEPTPKTPRITWSQSTKDRHASQPELRTPDKTIAPEDIGLPGSSISRHRRGQSPLNGSERMLPLISSVLQESGGAQRSRRLRVQTTPTRPITFTPFNSPTDASMPSGLLDSESAERPRSSIFPEQSPRL